MKLCRRKFKGIRVVSFDKGIFERFETKEYLCRYLGTYTDLECFKDKEIFITAFDIPYLSAHLECEILKRLIDTTRVNKLLQEKLSKADNVIIDLYKLIDIINIKNEEISELNFRLQYTEKLAAGLVKYKFKLEKIEHSRAQSRDVRRKNKAGQPGRPRANIDMEEVMKMRANGLKDRYIARYFDIAPSTLCKYIKEYKKSCV